MKSWISAVFFFSLDKSFDKQLLVCIWNCGNRCVPTAIVTRLGSLRLSSSAETMPRCAGFVKFHLNKKKRVYRRNLCVLTEAGGKDSVRGFASAN